MYPPTAMDLFPAGGFVRLRASFYENYVYADEDAVGVSLRPLGDTPSINAVWMVEHCYVEGDAAPYIMIQSTAYGRYLAVTNRRMRIQRGFRVVQRDYDCPNLDPRFVWRPYRVQGGYVVLSNPWDLNLRANAAMHPSYDLNPLPWIVTACRPMNWRVHWKVEAIPPSPEPLPLPPPPPPQSLDLIAGLPDLEFDPPPLGRRIRYALANDEGDVHQELTDRPNFFYEGRSVFDLRTLVGHDCKIVGITLCVLAGKNARPIPLVTDLPVNQDPMEIVVYTNGSRAAAGLRFPQFDLPEP